MELSDLDSSSIEDRPWTKTVCVCMESRSATLTLLLLLHPLCFFHASHFRRNEKLKPTNMVPIFGGTYIYHLIIIKVTRMRHCHVNFIFGCMMIDDHACPKATCQKVGSSPFLCIGPFSFSCLIWALHKVN